MKLLSWAGKKDSTELKATIAYALCSIIQKTLALISTPIFTRMLTTDQYGQFSVYTSWSAILTIFITLNLSFGTFNRAMVKFKEDRKGYISSIQSLIICFAILFSLVFFSFRPILENIITLSPELVLLIVFDSLFQFGLLCWMAENRFELKYKAVIIVTLITSVSSIILSLILIQNMTEKGIARILGFVLVNIFVGVVFFIKNYVSGKKIFNRSYWKYALTLNIPLIAYYLSQIIFNASDKIMIEKLCSISDAGLYSLGYTIALLLVFVLNAINNSYIPSLYKRIEEKKVKSNQGIAIIITLIMCVLVGGVIWIAPEVVFLMGGTAYASSVYVIPPVSVSLILLLYTSFFTNIQFYYEMRFRLTFASIGAAVVNIVLNYLLLPIYGYLVAGYTTLISYVIFCLSNYFMVRKKICKGGELEGVYNLKILFEIFIIFLLMAYVGVILYPYMWARYISIFSVILLLILFRKKIANIVFIITHTEVKNPSFFKLLRYIFRPITKKYRSIVAKKYTNKKLIIHGEINIVFLCQCQHIWDKTKSVVDRLRKKSNYNITLLIVEDEGVIDGTIFEVFARDHKVNYVKYHKGIIKDIKPDIVFYSRPYDSYLPEELRSYKLLRKSKLIYIPYGYSLMAIGKVNLNDDFCQNISLLFADCTYAHKYFIDNFSKKNKALKSYDIGFPYLEDLYTNKQEYLKSGSVFKLINKTGTRVIWTPRWSADDKIGGSNLLKYIDKMFELFIGNKDFNFVFRPHPYALKNFVEKGLLDESKKNYYLETIKDSDNSVFDDSKEYLSTFFDSDVLITDVSSIVAEYLFTKKPVIFCHNEGQEVLNEETKKMCDTIFYNAYNFEQIKDYIVQIRRGEDPLKPKRESFIKDFIKKQKGTMDRIEEVLLNQEKDWFIRK